MLQRQCACGTHTPGGGECAACGNKKLALQRRLMVDASSDSLEAWTDRIADRVIAAPAMSPPGTRAQCFGHDFSCVREHALHTPAPETLALSTLIQGTGVARPVLQRAIKAVPTWAGEFRLDEYDATRGVDNPDVNGATLTMHFHPNEQVDAEQIAFVQQARSLVDARPYTKDYGDEAQQKTAIGRNIPAGEVGQGSHIDQMPYSRTPLAGMKKAGGDQLANPKPNKKYTDIGFHFTDPDGNLQQHDAMLHDEPNLVKKPDIEQAQEFETAALAIKGKQQGVYYGSVEWGWFKYPTQKYAQLSEFKVKSKDAPSAIFQRAAMSWNASQTSDKEASLPVPGMRMYRTSATTQLRDAPGKGNNIGRLARNVRVGLTDAHESVSPPFWLNVVVVGGPLAGKRGWVAETVLVPDREQGKRGN